MESHTIRILLAAALVAVSVPALAVTALPAGGFHLTTDANEARSIYEASLRSGACASVGISVDERGVWAVNCRAPNGADNAGTEM